MVGRVSNEVEANVAAGEAWELYSMLQLVKLVQEALSGLDEKIVAIEVEGNWGVELRLFST